MPSFLKKGVPSKSESIINHIFSENDKVAVGNPICQLKFILKIEN